MTNGYSLSVSLSPGTGIVARRGHTLLFVPEPDDRAERLLNAFMDGPLDDVWGRLSEAVIDQQFDTCAFSCVSAADRIQLRVFGATQLDADLRSVPMLSGAGSGTWVEHLVSDRPATAAVNAGTDGVDDRTALVEGVVHAGGYAATFTDREAPVAESTAPPASATSTPPTETQEPLDSELLTYVQGLTTSSDEQPRSEPAPAPEPTQSPDPEPDPEPERAPTPEPAPEPGPERTPDADDEQLDDTTLNPEQVAELVADSPRIASRVCKAGHVNSPNRTMCEICDVFLPAGQDGVTFEQRPSLGTLTFEDGQSIELVGDVVVGRNPSRPGDHWIPVTTDGERVSRTHLTVRCNDWEVLLEDAGSQNGTVVLPAVGSQPVALNAGTPFLIEPGARVYFGSLSFQFEGRRP